MRILILFSFFFAGCASVSDYQQGCRDGVGELPKYARYAKKDLVIKVNQEQLDLYCQMIEKNHKRDNEVSRH